MNTAIDHKLPRTLFTAALALAGTLASFSATTQSAQAAPAGGSYSATLAAQLPEARREIIDGAIWRCAGERCAAPADGGRAQVVCGRVARKFGQVARFAGPQGALSSEQLTRCNGAN